MNRRGPDMPSAGPCGTKRLISSVDGAEQTPRPAKKRLVTPTWLRLGKRAVCPPQAGREWPPVPPFAPNSGSHKTPAWTVPTPNPPSSTVAGLSETFGRLKCDDDFSQFSRLPPELRRLVWQHTWEHRVVTLTRKLVVGPFSMAHILSKNRIYYSMLLCARSANAERTKSLYGIPRRHPSYSDSVFSSPSIRTTTWSNAPLPVSLSVNRESRHETLLHFVVALGQEGGYSRVYFNFKLDILRLPLHTPLPMCFGRDELALLTRLAVPELVPTLSAFASVTGPWDERMATPSPQNGLEEAPRPDASGALHDEFRLVWTYLRRWFPNIREISLERWDTCKRSGTSPRYRTAPPFTTRDARTMVAQLDYHCHSCYNLCQGILRRSRPIANDWEQFPWMDYVLDQYNIGRPVWRQERVSIGTVRVPPRAGGGVYEDVVVTFWTISKSERRRREPDFRLRCVARSLERFFRNTTHDFPVYRI